MSDKAAQAGPSGGGMFKPYLHYLNANLLGTLAGLISFPILTRLLDKSQFGILGYYEIISLVWIALLKLGTQHSILRLYSTCFGKNDPQRERQFMATMVLVPGLISTGLCLLGVLTTIIVNAIRPFEDFKYLVIVLSLGQVGVLISLTSNIIRAREHAGHFSLIQIISRYMDLIFILLLVVYIDRSAMSVFWGRTATAWLILIYLAYWTFRHFSFSLHDFSPQLFRESNAFGLPLTLSEMSLILMAFGDRLFIRPMLGDEQLGIYTIGYGLAMYVGLFVRESMMQAFQPIANRIYETRGNDAARQFEGQMLRFLLYTGVAICIGLSVVGGDLLRIVAGHSNFDSVPTFIVIGMVYVIQPVFEIASYGLTLARKSRVIMLIVAGSAGLNLLLNWWLIPHFGLMGSVYATVICYALGGALRIAFVPHGMHAIVHFMDLFRPLALGLLLMLMTAQTQLFGLVNPFARLALMGVITLLVYVIPALAWDAGLRATVMERFGPLLARLRRAA